MVRRLGSATALDTLPLVSSGFLACFVLLSEKILCLSWTNNLVISCCFVLSSVDMMGCRGIAVFLEMFFFVLMTGLLFKTFFLTALI